MIKIKTKYDDENDIFTIVKFDLKNTCRFEMLALIHELEKTLLENDEDLDKKTMNKILKDMDKNEEIEVI